MSVPTKVYVACDYANAESYYDVMKAWSPSPETEYAFLDSSGVKFNAASKTTEVLQGELELRIRESSVVVFLVNESTKYPFKYLSWEIAIAIRLRKPLIVVNLNGARVPDVMCCPEELMQTLALHIPFNQKVVEYAIAKWPADSVTLSERGRTFYYSGKVFARLGV